MGCLKSEDCSVYHQLSHHFLCTAVTAAAHLRQFVLLGEHEESYFDTPLWAVVLQFETGSTFLPNLGCLHFFLSWMLYGNRCLGHL